MKSIIIFVITIIIFPSVVWANGSSPQGRPFVEIIGLVSDIKDQLNLLVVRMDTLEGQLGANEDAILILQQKNADLEAQLAMISEQADYENLQDLISQNLQMIHIIEAEIDSIDEQLVLKQNIIDGNCADGSAVTQVLEDGSLVCVSVGTGEPGTFETVRSFYSTAVAPFTIQTTRVFCPDGYSVTGGGFSSRQEVYSDYGVVRSVGPFSETGSLDISGWESVFVSRSSIEVFNFTSVVCGRIVPLQN